MMYQEPWSKKHKKVTGGTPFSLSNSFADPLSNEELVKLSLERGDHEIVADFHKHSLVYTPNGGSLDLREEIAKFYGDDISAENIVVFTGLFKFYKCNLSFRSTNTSSDSTLSGSGRQQSTGQTAAHWGSS